jgi:hypothetical protein
MERPIKKISSVLLVAVTITTGVLAQIDNGGIFLTDQQGTVIGNNKNPYADIQGSPFLFEDWINGEIILRSNQVYTAIPLKLNIHTQEIHILDKSNNEIIPESGIIEHIRFRLKDRDYAYVFRKVDQPKRNRLELLEVLVDGNVRLLKHVSRNTEEIKEFNSAVTVKKFREYTEYYIETGSRLRKTERLMSFWEQTIPEKKEFIASYFSEKRNKLKSEKDLIQFVSQLNN